MYSFDDFRWVANLADSQGRQKMRSDLRLKLVGKLKHVSLLQSNLGCLCMKLHAHTAPSGPVGAISILLNISSQV